MATKSGSRKHGRAQSHESPPSGVPSSPWLGVHARRVLQASPGISRHARRVLQAVGHGVSAAANRSHRSSVVTHLGWRLHERRDDPRQPSTTGTHR